MLAALDVAMIEDEVVEVVTAAMLVEPLLWATMLLV